ncbi:hypothetical protein V6Z11_A10G238900 [Gossypium hirsutum]
MLQYDFSCFKLAFNTESLLTKMRTSHSQKFSTICFRMLKGNKDLNLVPFL